MFRHIFIPAIHLRQKRSQELFHRGKISRFCAFWETQFSLSKRLFLAPVGSDHWFRERRARLLHLYCSGTFLCPPSTFVETIHLHQHHSTYLISEGEKSTFSILCNSRPYIKGMHRTHKVHLSPVPPPPHTHSPTLPTRPPRSFLLFLFVMCIQDRYPTSAAHA